MAGSILLTGVCYVARLLELRYSNNLSPIPLIHPNFEVDKLDFFHKDIEQRFIFSDFHGRWGNRFQRDEQAQPTFLSDWKRFKYNDWKQDNNPRE